MWARDFTETRIWAPWLILVILEGYSSIRTCISGSAQPGDLMGRLEKLPQNISLVKSEIPCLFCFFFVVVVVKDFESFVKLAAVYVHAQSGLTLCDPLNCSPSGSSVRGSFQARILKWVAISSSRGSSWPMDQTCVSCVSCTSRQILYHLGSQKLSGRVTIFFSSLNIFLKK